MPQALPERASAVVIGGGVSGRQGRHVRHSPIHERLVQQNACFGKATDWERPNRGVGRAGRHGPPKPRASRAGNVRRSVQRSVSVRNRATDGELNDVDARITFSDDVMFVGILSEISVSSIDNYCHNLRPFFHCLGHFDSRANVSS